MCVWESKLRSVHTNVLGDVHSLLTFKIGSLKVVSINIIRSPLPLFFAPTGVFGIEPVATYVSVHSGAHRESAPPYTLDGSCSLLL